MSLCMADERRWSRFIITFHYQDRCDGTTSFSKDGVRLTSRLLYLELVGWVGSPRQQLDSSMAYHVSAQSRTGWDFP